MRPRSSRPSRNTLWALLAVLLWFAVGCGRDSGQVRIRGDVSFDGQPLTAGTIILTPVEGTPGPSTGGRITDGRYDVPADKGPLVGGHYSVEITAVRNTGRTMPNKYEQTSPAVEVSEQFVPEVYNTRSTLRVIVTKGVNTANFALASAEPK
jgi:hypothetical protein